jgi:protein-disulfide isomerase
MPKMLRIALVASLFAAPSLAAEATKDQVSRYFAGWFSVCPGTRISVTTATEIALPGYEAFRVERQCDLKHREQVSVTLVDKAKNEVFVGEVLHSDERAGQTFQALRDVPVLEEAMHDAFGVPVSITLDGAARGPFLPIRLSLRQADNAVATLPGYVSKDGANVLLGEFRPLDGDAAGYRDRLLAGSTGVRPVKGKFYVTAFIDFQCERCRQRTPEVREFVEKQGGGLEIRFLPLVKVHNWAFAAAEDAAALSNISPALYLKFEEAIFPRSGQMSAEAARQIAVDVADAAGVRDAFETEISSGHARERVVRDIALALRLGLNSTPVFFYRGAFLTSDAGIVEEAVGGKRAAPAKTPPAGASH